MSAFKKNIDVEFSVSTLPELVDSTRRGKRQEASASGSGSGGSHKAVRINLGTTADGKTPSSSSAPGLKVGKSVLKKGGRGDSAAANINLSHVNSRGAALAEAKASGKPLNSQQAKAGSGRAQPGGPTGVGTSEAMPPTGAGAGAGDVDEVGGGNSSSNQQLAGGSGSGSNGQQTGNSGTDGGAVTGGGGPLPTRMDRRPSRRPGPAHKREAALPMTSSQLQRSAHPTWNKDVRKPNREEGLLQLDDEIDKKKCALVERREQQQQQQQQQARLQVQLDGDQDDTGGDGDVPLTQQQGNEGKEQSAVGIPLGRHHGKSTDRYADNLKRPVRVRYAAGVCGPVVNGKGHTLYNIGKVMSNKEEDVAHQHILEPEPLTKANHDNIRGNVLYNDTINGHNGGFDGKTHGIHSTAWNASEVTTSQLDKDFRLLPAPIDKLVPMYSSSSGSHGGNGGNGGNGDSPVLKASPPSKEKKTAKVSATRSPLSARSVGSVASVRSSTAANIAANAEKPTSAPSKSGNKNRNYDRLSASGMIHKNLEGPSMSDISEYKLGVSKK